MVEKQIRSLKPKELIRFMFHIGFVANGMLPFESIMLLDKLERGEGMNKVKEEKDGIQLKNYCDKCEKTTWHRYVTYENEKDPEKRIKVDSYYKCDICGTTRLLKEWKTKRKEWKKKMKEGKNG